MRSPASKPNPDKVFSLQIISQMIWKGQIHNALAECLMSIEHHPEDYKLLILIGDLYLKLGNHKQAIEYFLQAADCCTESGHYRKAIAILKRVMNLDANLTSIHLGVADLYQQLGLNNEAKAELVILIEQSQKSQRMDSDTIQAYLKLIQLGPENLGLRQKILQILGSSGMMDQLRNQYLEMSIYADFFISKGRLSDAYDWIQALLKDHPENPEYLERLELILDAQSRCLQEELTPA